MKATSGVKSQLKIKKAELDAAVTAENPDRKSVDRLIKEIGDMQNQLLKEKIYHRIEVRSILDDKQKLRFDQMQHHMMEGPRKGKRG